MAKSKEKTKGLQVKKIVSLHVDHNNLSEFIGSIYNQKFDVTDDQEIGNDSICDVKVNGKVNAFWQKKVRRVG